MSVWNGSPANYLCVHRPLLNIYVGNIIYVNCLYSIDNLNNINRAARINIFDPLKKYVTYIQYMKCKTFQMLN